MSPIGTKRTCRRRLKMSAHRGKADLALRPRASPAMTYTSGAKASWSSICQESKAKVVDRQPIAIKLMQKPPLNPDVADTAPSDSVLTVYDEEHIITYLRLLDADAQDTDWRDVAHIVLHLDPEHESDRAGGLTRPSIARQMDDGGWLSAPVAWCASA